MNDYGIDEYEDIKYPESMLVPVIGSGLKFSIQLTVLKSNRPKFVSTNGRLLNSQSRIKDADFCHHVVNPTALYAIWKL